MWLLLAILFASDSAFAEFAKYPAETALKNPAAPVRMETSRAREFRTVLRREAVVGPNFNGHYRIAKWGCGTNCIEWAVINLVNGSTWFAPHPQSSCFVPEGSIENAHSDWLESRVDSRLFYIYGCSKPSNRTFNRRYVYEWKNARAALRRVEHLE